MTQAKKLTTNASEDEISSLMSKDAIFVIPFFQRPYKWKANRLEQFDADLGDLVEKANDLHFLGAIITHERKADPALPKRIEVIDGQQRITTIFLYICAIVKELCIAGKREEAREIFFNHLAVKRGIDISNIRLHSCREDRAQLNWVFFDLLNDEKFKRSLGKFSLRPLETSGERPAGQIKKNFHHACAFISAARKRSGIVRVRAIYKALTSGMSLVRLELFNPLNGPKIFDSLNSRQETMTIGELVRNDIFSRVSDESLSTLEYVDANFWQPFYEKFHLGGKNLFDEYFFPYGLIQDANLKKSAVYAELRKRWGKKKGPEEVIKQLATPQDAFIDICTGSNLSGHPQKLALAFKQLSDLGAPGAIRPFFMQLSLAVSEGSVPSSMAVKITRVVEDFLVRRAVCGHEPTGLHAVFKRLWGDCKGTFTAAKVAAVIAGHKTVVWPDNDAFKKAICSRPLYGAGITKFVILQYDKSLGGDDPSDTFYIEHILPSALSSEWKKLFSTEAHSKMKDLLANLLPLSGTMNSSLGNQSFGKKKKRYSHGSMFVSARQFAKSANSWTPKELSKRSNKLANWAVKRWPSSRG